MGRIFKCLEDVKDKNINFLIVEIEFKKIVFNLKIKEFFFYVWMRYIYLKSLCVGGIIVLNVIILLFFFYFIYCLRC